MSHDPFAQNTRYSNHLKYRCVTFKHAGRGKRPLEGCARLRLRENQNRIYPDHVQYLPLAAKIKEVEFLNRSRNSFIDDGTDIAKQHSSKGVSGKGDLLVPFEGAGLLLENTATEFLAVAVSRAAP